MAVNKRLLQGAAAAPGGLTPSEHFGVVLYEGDGSSSRSINGGKFGAAAYFNATNAKVSISQELDIGNINKSWTISYWAKTNATGFAPVIYARQTHNFNTQVKNDTVYYNFYNSAAQAISISHDVTDWTHVVLAHNGSTNTVTPYINGVAQTSKSTSGTQTQSQSDIIIGNNDGSGSANPKLLDQIRFFQKELSSSEVSTLYAETASTVESLDPLSEDTTDTLQVLGDSSCIATYRFENNEDNESGNYDGTGTEIQYAAGRYGQAASFTYSSSYIEIPSSTSPLGFINSNFTYSMWVKPENHTENDLIGNWDTGTSANNQFLMIYNGKLRMHIKGAGMGDSTGSISTNVWTHVIVTIDYTNGQGKYYINGSLDSTKTISTTPPSVSAATALFIGTRQAPPAAPKYGGDIDQVRIFNKALSASEVTTLYNENSLVASYRFEGNANDDTRNYDGTASNVTYEYGLGFQPDLIWAKDRVATGEWHMLSDSTRGTNSQLFSNEQNPQDTKSTVIQSFDTGGFTVGSDNLVNNNGNDYVAWCWKANGGTTTSGTGTGGVSSVTHQLNSDAGFCITKFTSASSAGGTVTHGLDSIPDLIIMKAISSTQSWWVWHNSFADGNQYLQLQTNAVQGSNSNVWNSTAPSASVVTLGAWNSQSFNYIMYAFKNVDGFSSFGSYVGNGSEQLIETGFEPAFVMTKSTSATGHWRIYDNKRGSTDSSSSYVGNRKILYADEYIAEGAGINEIRFLSNGFEVGPGNNTNTNGVSFIYMAFAADPDTEAPTVAKSFDIQTYDMTGGSDYDLSFAFKPQFVVTKTRDEGAHWSWGDIIRGNNSNLSSNDTNPVNTTNQWRVKDWYAGATTVTIAQHATTSTSNVSYAQKADDNEPTIFGGAAKAVYKFEDNANDVTGNNNGTAYNVTYSSSGKFNKAAEFNGTNAYIDTGITNTVGQRSISLWFYYTGAPSATQSLIGAVTSGSAGYTIRLETTKLKFQNQGQTGPETALSNLNTNDWNHVVGVIDGSTSKLYLNGELKDTGGAAGAGTHNLFIAARNDVGSADQFFDNKIDQVRIYDGVVSDIGVAALYAETASDNDDTLLGGPPETIISANANAGFSIVKYEGNGSTQKIPHGLGQKPDFVVIKHTNDASAWVVFSDATGTFSYSYLNLTNGFTAYPQMSWDSTVINLNSGGDQNGAGDTHIAYFFTSIAGYSKIGSYTGNGNATGPTVTLNFAPDWIMIKRTDSTGDWRIWDSVRDSSTPNNNILKPNSSEAEAVNDASAKINFLTTGFQPASTHSSVNTSGATYIYMAFKIN